MTYVETLVAIAALGILPSVAIALVRARSQQQNDERRIKVRLDFPNDVSAEMATAFMRSLVMLGRASHPIAGRSSAVLETLAIHNTIEHRLRLPEAHAESILRQLRTAVPMIGTEVIEDDELPEMTTASTWRLSSRTRTLRTDRLEAVAASLLAGLGPLGTGQCVRVQWVIAPAKSQAPVQPTSTNRSSSPWQQLLLPGQPVEIGSPKDQRDKSGEPIFQVTLRVGTHAATKQSARAITRRVAGSFRTVERPGMRFKRRMVPERASAYAIQTVRTPVLEWGGVLNAKELTAVCAWPMGAPLVPGLKLGASRRFAPSEDVPSRGRVLGDSDVPGSNRPVAISAADSLRHMHVIGPTGVGKSTLVANLIMQDIADGRGVVVIDPKGDLVTDVADRIPEERTGDVIWLDPTDEERPVSLNLLHGSQDAPELVTDAVVAIFRRLYGSYFGPRTSDLVTSGLLTLVRRPGMTLCELPVLFTDDAFRRQLVGALDDPVLLGFWAWYEALSVGERAAALGPVMNKLRALLLRQRLRNVIGQAEPTWSLGEVLDQRRILLVNLAKGQLGSEAAAQLGSLVVALLWRAIQVRTVRTPAMVFIDEFQDVLNLPTDLGDVLAQARGFGVGLTLAHQHLGQLSPAMRTAVLANARSKVVFQAAADDAAVLAKQVGGGLVGTDLSRLPAFHAYVAACVSASVLPPTSIATRPMSAATGNGAAVRNASRNRYGRDKREVEQAILDRTVKTPDDTPGRRPRTAN